MAGKADVTSASSLARSTALFRGNFSMIDIRPSYWTLPFIKWSQCARNSGQYSLAKPFRGIALANGELIETSDSWRKIRETTATFYREDVAHLMDAHETSERRDVDIGCC